MSCGPGVTPANFAKFFFIFARTASSTLIWSFFDGRPLAAGAAAAAVVLVPGMTAPVIRARNGCPAGPAAPAWADGNMNAAISAAAVIGSVRLSSALRMCLFLRASVGWRPAPPVTRRAEAAGQRGFQGVAPLDR